ncbi:MAG: hypothetical protein OXE96_14335 [Gemmatimonadetes bacterium]|nr:hypothetical protein [Gemmatimonadota bacterium]
MKKPWQFSLPYCVLVALVAGGCSWFDDPSPAVVSVTLDAQADSFVIITSTDFFTATNEAGEVGIQVLNSDTTVISFPFERSWDIEDEGRFLLLGLPADSGAVTVRLRVLLDGDEDYDASVRALIDDPVRYIYLFNQTVLQDIELL